MYILHYSLGFPPYRIGGLTKFCMDMMDYQLKIGNQVSLLWPGRIPGGRTKIVHSKVNGYDSYEVINPLPVSICNGIRDDKEYTRPFDSMVFDMFLDDIKPDVIHVHTLEGLPIEFLQTAKHRNIKLIYTTHDLFGVCPTNDLYKGNRVCDVNCVECVKCNQNAFSKAQIKVMQSLPYRLLKNTSLLTLLRKKIRKDAKAEVQSIEYFDCDYSSLKKYYRNCFMLFDVIHCNSSITYEVFEKFIGKKALRIANITNSSVIDKRQERKNKIKNKINILYLGVEVENKGFFFLVDILDELRRTRNDFRLVIYSQDDKIKRDYIEKHGVYTYNELDHIYNQADLLIVPSLRLETFGFVTIEAFYHGVPALVMDTVGSKDIIKNEITGFISSKELFIHTLSSILDNKEKLFAISENIKTIDLNLSIESVHNVLYIEGN